MSLKDQLLKAGVIDKKQAKKAKKSSKKSRTLKKEIAAATEQSRQEQQAKSQEKNALLKAEADQKAITAQIKQLIEMNRIDRKGGDVGYNFTHGTSIKTIYVNDVQQKQLINGRLSIVMFGEEYELVATAVADKIAQRDESLVLLSNQVDDAEVDEDDPYAEFQIPDDLMW
ncbi:DUF2058 domain-containing protein [Catenovulum sp. SM1970]|uniref:DUF2058 domain-containing protein n=1 Tax=Marinifaba aquimaris TaxID=2741323 RepID=UPI00157309F4|nr:DUF2058 domain-containing protein [Marinifaba aquimaris]NTS77464.1 DUF2058 domain-containing protein [Marinifaba aquimaris]